MEKIRFSRYVDPKELANNFVDGVAQATELMKKHGKFTENTTFEELANFALSHIEINHNQPERLSEKTSKDDAIV